MNARPDNKNSSTKLSPQTADKIPTTRAPKKVPHVAIDISVNHSCHQPVLPMSCNLLVVNEMVGMMNITAANKDTIGIKPTRLVNKIHHQYSALVARPLKLK